MMIKLLMVAPSIYHNPLVSFNLFLFGPPLLSRIFVPPPLFPLKIGLLLGLHNRVGGI